MKKLNMRKFKIILAILLVILCVLGVICYNVILYTHFMKEKFADNVVKIAEGNENAVFKVHKVMLYSSANAVDVTDTQALQGLHISQYTDIAIFLDNTSYIYDLTSENTVNQLYIDNIQIKVNGDVGHPLLNYKNALDFAKYKDLQEPVDGIIDFNVINTNSENESNDYSTPTFYTDCSNPITLGFMNKDIVTDYAVSEGSNTVSFNGKILQEANVNLQDINYTLSFNINIVNNQNEKFIYNMKLNVDLSGDDGGIYKGYLYDNYTTSGSEYEFFKAVK